MREGRGLREGAWVILGEQISGFEDGYCTVSAATVPGASLFAVPCGTLPTHGARERQSTAGAGGPFLFREQGSLWWHEREDGLISYLFFFPKNFTALIPGTTVEILHGDSKNIIQLIINAYNVSHQLFPTEALGAGPDSGGQRTVLACSALLANRCLLSLVPLSFPQVGDGEGCPADTPLSPTLPTCLFL